MPYRFWRSLIVASFIQGAYDRAPTPEYHQERSLSQNGAVILAREMRIRLTPQHRRSLEGLAKVHGWKSLTEFAESLLADAIERASINTAQRLAWQHIADTWHVARVA